MAKKQRTMRPMQMYNRPTKAFQQNMSKNMMDLNPPAMPTRKQTLTTSIIVIAVLVIMAVLFGIFLPWWTLFLPVILALVYVIVFGRFMNKKQVELVSYYQQMGLSKKYFLQQGERQSRNSQKGKKNQKKAEQNTSQNMAYYAKIWDIVAGKDVKLSFMDKVMGMKVNK